MTINCCKTNDIHRYNDEKEYTLLATDILNAVLTDTSLSAGSAKLWQFLYSKGRFEKTLTVQIEQRYLAACFKKHMRTIARYLNELEDSGYIQTTANYSNLGSRLANTYQLTLPGAIKSTLENRPNRRRAEKQEVAPPDKIALESPDKTVRTNNNIKYNNNNNITVVELSSDEFPKSCGDTPNSDISSSMQSANSDEGSIKSMFHVEQSDTNDNSKKANQHAQLSLSDEDNSRISKLNKNLEKAKQTLQRLKDEFKCTDNPIRRNELLQAITTHEACHDKFETDLASFMRQIQDKRCREFQTEQVNTNPEYMLEVEGKRSFTPFEFNRLKKALSRHYSDIELPKMINEVAYSIRFGDLEIQQGSNQPLEIHHAISIAIKLVREGRWQKPAGLDEFLKRVQET